MSSCVDFKAKCKECFDVLNKVWNEWKDKEGILNIQVSTKFSDGKDTGEPSLTFYVIKKKPKSKLKANLIPPVIDGIKTDVVELATDDFELGDTGVSKRDPKIQKIMANGIKCIEEE